MRCEKTIQVTAIGPNAKHAAVHLYTAASDVCAKMCQDVPCCPTWPYARLTKLRELLDERAEQVDNTLKDMLGVDWAFTRVKLQKKKQKKKTQSTMGTLCKDCVRFALSLASAYNLQAVGDAGSGLGNLVALAALLGYETYGIEHETSFYQHQQDLFKKLGLPFQEGHLKYGDLYTWKPPKALVIVCNNYLFQNQGWFVRGLMSLPTFFS